MAIQPHSNISSARAMDLINDGLPLVDAYVNGTILLSGENDWDKEIVIENCIIDYFDINCSTFKKPIRLINTHFKDCRFIFSFFLQGFTIDNCIFDKYLDFQAGGHNQIGCLVTIKNNSFSDFVNFFDCWYKGEVYVTNNTFQKGTNIQSINQYLTFDIPPVITDNVGQIDIEAESAD
jgi:hypothetical protein